MRKQLVLPLVMASVTCVIGCEEAVDTQSALDRAIQKVEQASVGYVPGQDNDMRAYRQRTLGEAAQELQTVANSGTPAEQSAARRLLAELHLSAARHAAREASMAYGELLPRAIELSSLILDADRAGAREKSLDQGQPQVVASLQQAVTEQTRQQQQLGQERTQLQSQLEAAQAEVAQIRERSNAAMARAQELRDQAFVKEGDERFNLENDAAAAAREASIADAEAQRKQLDVDIIQSKLAVVNSQLELVNNLVAELNNRVQKAQERQQEIQTATGEAQKNRQESLAALQQKLGTLMNEYNTQVEERYARATARVAEAIQALQAAQQGAGPAARQGLQADLLAARTTQAQLLTEHLFVTDGFHDVVKMLDAASARLPGAGGGAFSQQVQTLAQRKGDLATQAQQAIQSAQELAGQSAAAEGQYDYAASLQQYASRVGQIAGQ